VAIPVSQFKVEEGKITLPRPATSGGGSRLPS